MTTQTGDSIGNYKLAELLGRGTFGSVYLAWHVVLKNRPVAIKLMHDLALSEEQEHARFLQEAHVLDRLKHPSILPLIDVGIHNKGEPYLVMEYAPNGTLRDLLSRRKGQVFPVEEALHIVARIGQALQYAHDHTIVHRDVKPANILFDAKGDALLADFGIALPLETMKGTLQADALGTPMYMAPEQFENRVSPQSDQYALACVLYEVLTGQPPFLASTLLAFAYKHAAERPLPLRERGPHIPPLVEQAILRALAKSREDRFPSIADFLLALQPAPSVSIHSTKSAEQLVHTENEPRLHDTITFPVMQSVPDHNMVDDGQTLFEQERYEEALVCLWQAIQQNPKDIRCVHLLGSTLFMLGRFDEAVQQFEYALTLGEQTTGFFHVLGVAQHTLHRYEEALCSYEQGLARDPHSAQLYLLKGEVLESLARDNEALLSYYQALHHDIHLVEGYRNAGSVLTRQQRYEEALSMYLAAYDNVPSSDNSTFFLLGNAYFNLQRYEEALQYYACVEENEPYSASLFKNIGDASFALERFIEALTAYEQAIRLAPEEVLYVIDKGNTLYQLHYYQEALACYEHVLNLDADNAVAWYNVGQMQTCLGNEREAQKAYKRARKLGFH